MKEFFLCEPVDDEAHEIGEVEVDPDGYKNGDGGI